MDSQPEERYYGIDFDGVLAKTQDGPHDDGYVGAPIERSIKRVKEWLKEGKKVKIITARASSGNPIEVAAIHKFLHDVGLPALEVTACKSPGMIALWDDRAVAVERNTGIPLSPEVFSATAVNNIYNWDEEAEEPVSSVIVFSDDNVVIVSNSDGEYMFPTGHAERGETPAETASRELQEETGIKIPDDQLVFVTRTSLGNGKYNAVFAVKIPEKIKVKAGDDAEKAKWSKISDIPKLKFGHADLIPIASAILNSQPVKRGLLIVFEGLDGSGKSTQIDRLAKSLLGQNIPFTVNKWNSAEGVSDVISMMKKQKRLTPELFFLMHAADMIYRWQNTILPALMRNEVVLCDRYYYTGIVRDAIRGIDANYNQQIYSSLRQPDVLFFCKVDPEVAVERLVKEGDRLSHYSSGMDVGTFGTDKETSALGYEKKMDELYNAIIPQSATRLDCSAPPDDIAYLVEAIVSLAMARKYDHGETIELPEPKCNSAEITNLVKTQTVTTETINEKVGGITFEIKGLKTLTNEDAIMSLTANSQKMMQELAEMRLQFEKMRLEKPKPKAKIVEYKRDENGRPTGMTIREEE